MKQEIISPLNDYVFKTVLCQNIPALREFLTVVLDLPPEELEELTLLDPTLAPKHPEGKTAIVDLKLRTKSGLLIYIDVQRRKIPHLVAKILVLWGENGGGTG